MDQDLIFMNEMKVLVDGIMEAVRCPVCLEKLRPPVISCENGHGTCSLCRGNLDICSLCRAAYSATSMRMVEQVVSLLPEPCPYTDKGCPTLALSSHSQFCEYRPIKCIMEDYSCKWTGTVKDWIVHLNNTHTIIKNTNINETRNMFYSKFNKTWVNSVACYYVDNNYFIRVSIKKNEMLNVTVRHVPIRKPNNQYLIDTTFKQLGSENILYKSLSTAEFLEKDEFEKKPTIFPLRDLTGAVRNNELHFTNKFIKESLTT